MPRQRIENAVAMNIDGRAQRAESADDERQRPVVGIVAGRKRLGGERRIGQPADIGRAAHAVKAEAADETEIEEQPAEGRHPEAECIEPREGHVARADHQRNQIIGDAEQNRHAHQKHHGGAVHGEQLVVEFRREEVVVRDGKLNADGHRLGSGDEKEEERINDVENAQLLVIDGDHPAMQPLEQRRAARGRCVERSGNRESLIGHCSVLQCKVERYATTSSICWSLSCMAGISAPGLNVFGS